MLHMNLVYVYGLQLRPQTFKQFDNNVAPGPSPFQCCCCYQTFKIRSMGDQGVSRLCDRDCSSPHNSLCNSVVIDPSSMKDEPSEYDQAHASL